MIEFFRGTVTPKDWAFVAVVLSIGALLAAGFYLVLYDRWSVDLAELDTRVKDLEGQYSEALQIKNDIEALRDESENMNTLVTQFEKRLPEEREIPQLLSQFETQGDDLGLRVELATMPTEVAKGKETIPYKVTVYGDFHQIVSFINLLERDERYLKISDIDLGEEEAGVSEATFTLSTFRFIDEPDKDNQPAADAAA